MNLKMNKMIRLTASGKTYLFLALLLAWALIFVFLSGRETGNHRPLRYHPGDKVPAGSLSVKPGATDENRVALIRPAKKLEITKNIFAPIYIYRPPPPPPPPPTPVVVPPPPSPEEVARAQAIAALSQFKYLGFLNKGGKSQGFFSRGAELYIVGKGDPVEGAFILKELDPNQAILKDRVTGVESTLILTN